MRRARMAVPAVLLTLAALSPLAGVARRSQSADTSADRAAVLRVEYRWLDAAQHHKRVVLDSILDDRFIDTAYDGTMRSKRDVLARSAAPAATHQQLRGCSVRLFGDTAVVTGVNHVSGQSSHGPWSVDVHFTDVFLREHGTWKAIAAQESIPPAQPRR